jgi:hypothetical protein
MTRSRRYEFPKSVKRAALKRSAGFCEATGPTYGIVQGGRCYADLSYGCEFDHWPLPATDKGSNTLKNCMAVCIPCHRFKTRKYDVPMQAKGKRVRDKHTGVSRPKGNWPKRGFGGWRDNSIDIRDDRT